MMQMSFYSVLALVVLSFSMTIYSLSTIDVFLRLRDEPEISQKTSYSIFAFMVHYFFGLLISCVLTLAYPNHTLSFAAIIFFIASSILIFWYFIAH